MATKQKYLSAKWKLGTTSGKRHRMAGIIIFIMVVMNTHDMQLVCCVVKKIRAFQKVSTAINIEKTAFFSTALLKGDGKEFHDPPPKKRTLLHVPGHFQKIYMKFKMRPKIKWTNRQNITTDWLLQIKQREMIFRLPEDSGRREGDTECPEMSLTNNP